MSMTREDAFKLLQREYKKMTSSDKKICCDICNEKIPTDINPEELDYVKPKSGAGKFYHHKCLSEDLKIQYGLLMSGGANG